MNHNKMTSWLLWVACFELIGYFLGIITQANIAPWYAHLHKSPWTPPGFVFSVVWTVLYALLGSIYWRLSQYETCTSPIKTLLALQMLMNWAWTPLFFQLHELKFSAIWLFSLTGLNAILIIYIRKIDKIAGLLWMPYLIWLMFASYLNGFIAWHN